MATILRFPDLERPIPMSPPNHDGAMARTSIDSGAVWAILMARAQAGDRGAYRSLLQDVVPYLRAIARRHLHQEDDVDDAVQEILMVMHDIRHTYEPGRPFMPWLSTIATRRCIDLLRRRMTRANHEAEAPDEDFDAVEPAPGPEEAAAREEAASRLRRHVERLPSHQRRAVQLVHLDEHSLGEAAQHAGQSSGSLKVACHRALKSLRRALAKTEDP